MSTSPRPTIRWWNSLTDLDDFALISWARRTTFDLHTPPRQVR